MATFPQGQNLYPYTLYSRILHLYRILEISMHRLYGKTILHAGLYPSVLASVWCGCVVRRRGVFGTLFSVKPLLTTSS